MVIKKKIRENSHEFGQKKSDHRSVESQVGACVSLNASVGNEEPSDWRE